MKSCIWKAWWIFVAFGVVLPLTGSGQELLHQVGRLRIEFGGVNDVWGYVDPAASREYALLGADGVYVIDVTDPSRPRQLAHVSAVPGFDIKTWENYAYSVTGGSRGKGGIVDLQDPENPEVAGTFPSSHNIFIDDRGFLYAASPGLKIYDLNPDPTTPRLVWEDGTTGGHDAAVIGTRLFDFHGRSGTFVYDIANPAEPRLLSTIIDPRIAYSHSGWTTPNGHYLYICDELASDDTPDITIWDIRDAENPERVGLFADPFQTVHNLYIVGEFAYVSYYHAGLRIYDIADPRNPKLRAEFDTSPVTGEGFGGAFGVYPFLPSANILLSDRPGGLFIFRFDGLRPGDAQGNTILPESIELRQNFPNPFNPQTFIEFALSDDAFVTLDIFDSSGRQVASLVAGVRPAGTHRVLWDGLTSRGIPAPAGIYHFRLRTGDTTIARKMTIVK